MPFRLMPWLRKKIVDPLMQIIRRNYFIVVVFGLSDCTFRSLLLPIMGAEPKQLALSTALGITLGVFPICGTTVFLCGLAIGLVGKHCHAPTLMLANFVATPIELSLIVPFLRLGELISGGHHFPLTSDALKKVITGQASKDVLVSILHALLGWIIAAPFILAALYTLLVPCFKLLVHRFSPRPSSPKIQLYPLTDMIMPKRSI